MRVVYVDTLLLLNLAVDYFLLLLTARVSGVYPKRSRLLLGAIVGAVFAVLFYFPVVPAALSVLLRIGVCAVTVQAAFYGTAGAVWLRLCGVFTMLTFLLAGAALLFGHTAGNAGFSRNGIPYFELSGTVMLFCFAVIYALSGWVLGKGRGTLTRRSHTVHAAVGERQTTFDALEDSGNLLLDPISGKRVMVSELSALRPLLGETLYRLLQSSKDKTAALPVLRDAGPIAFRLLSAKTALGSSLMLVFPPDQLYIDGVLREDYLLGIAAQPLEIGGDCHALMGG